MLVAHSDNHSMVPAVLDPNRAKALAKSITMVDFGWYDSLQSTAEIAKKCSSKS